MYNRFSKEDVSLNIFNQLENRFRSERFPGYSIYYEFFYDYFPSIEKFTFNEFIQKEFLFYLLELFPKIVAIIYKNKMNLWRITESELRDSGDDDFHMTRMVRNKTHNAIIYNKYHLPSFYPSKIGENNYEYYKIGLPDVHTPLFKIEKLKMRNIENEIRQERELPKIGEGWISETLLYYKTIVSDKK